MDYELGFKGVKINSLDSRKINLNVFMNFLNKSSQKLEIVEQEYKIYMDGSFAGEGVNYATNVIDPKSTSVLGVNVTFNPTKVLTKINRNWVEIITSPQNVVFKIDMKLKIKIWGIKFSIPYIYTFTLKEAMGY